jgi:hypothetical protein
MKLFRRKRKLEDPRVVAATVELARLIIIVNGYQESAEEHGGRGAGDRVIINHHWLVSELARIGDVLTDE